MLTIHLALFIECNVWQSNESPIDKGTHKYKSGTKLPHSILQDQLNNFFEYNLHIITTTNINVCTFTSPIISIRMQFSLQYLCILANGYLASTNELSSQEARWVLPYFSKIWQDWWLRRSIMKLWTLKFVKVLGFLRSYYCVCSELNSFLYDFGIYDSIEPKPSILCFQSWTSPRIGTLTSYSTLPFTICSKLHVRWTFTTFLIIISMYNWV